MNWLGALARTWRSLESASCGVPLKRRARRKKPPTLRALLEQLETRLAPAVGFDPVSGLLSVTGDEAGPRDDVIRVSVGGSFTRAAFVDVSINRIIHSSRPGSTNFDPALAGATRSSVRAIDVRGLEGNDTIALRGAFTNADGRVSLQGGAGADRIIGGRLPEILVGGSGDDSIYAGRGDDFAEGGAGNDTLLGGAGDDTLVGGPGTDSLRGGRGMNVLGQAGLSNATFDATTGLLSVTGDEHGPTNDVIIVSLTASGSVEVAINGALASSDPVSPDFDPKLRNASAATVTSIRIEGIESDDRLVVTGRFQSASGRISLQGGPGNDALTGSVTNDQLAGGPGDDTLSPGGGDDSVDGGTGTNRLMESGDVDFVLSDTRLAGLGIDVLAGIVEVDLTGGPGANRLDASGFTQGPVMLNGGAGDDTLVGATGNDVLDGDAGNDLVVQVTDADQTLTDGQLRGQGTDTLVSVERAALAGGPGANVLDATGFALGPVTLDGGDGDDTLFGSESDDALVGGPGADWLDGRGGTDRVLQTVDADQTLADALLTGEGPDVLLGIEQASLSGGVGANTLDASGFSLGSVTLDGGAGNDTLRGSPSGDVLDGGSGEDLLEGSTGDDTLNGGDGEDTFVAGTGNDSLDGGPGTDLVTQTVDADQTLSNTLLTGEGTDQINDIESARLSGGPGNNIIRAHNSFCGDPFTLGPVTLDGGAGDDGLVSGRGSDLVIGGPGNDILTNACGGGQDTLLGGDGNDQLRSGPGPSIGGSGGANLLDGGPGDDELIANGDNDTLLGGPGSDTFGSRCGIEFVSDMEEEDVNGGCDPGPL